jgi:hypothetical protein
MKFAAADSDIPLNIAAAENFFRCCAFFALAFAASRVGDFEAFSSMVCERSIRLDDGIVFMLALGLWILLLTIYWEDE